MALDHDYLRYYKIKADDKILDLGATIGEFGDAFAREIIENRAMYIAVEPSLWNITRLSEMLNRKLLSNSLLISGGITKSDTVDTLFISNHNVLHTTSKEVQGWQHIYYDRRETFPLSSFIVGLSLDTLVKIFGNINFIKCDIEGAELDAFLGFKDWDKIESLAVAAYHIVNDKQTWETLVPFFESVGYKVVYEEGIIYCNK